MFGNIGAGELLVVFAIALIVFGPKKLPEIGKGMGNALREFNKARNDFMTSLNTDIDDEPRSHSITTTADDHAVSTPAPTARTLEFPEPLDAAHADALPYGGDFHAAEGDSQPSFRTASTTSTDQAVPMAAAAPQVSDHSPADRP